MDRPARAGRKARSAAYEAAYERGRRARDDEHIAGGPRAGVATARRHPHRVPVRRRTARPGKYPPAGPTARSSIRSGAVSSEPGNRARSMPWRSGRTARMRRITSSVGRSSRHIRCEAELATTSEDNGRARAVGGRHARFGRASAGSESSSPVVNSSGTTLGSASERMVSMAVTSASALGPVARPMTR